MTATRAYHVTLVSEVNGSVWGILVGYYYGYWYIEPYNGSDIYAYLALPYAPWASIYDVNATCWAIGCNVYCDRYDYYYSTWLQWFYVYVHLSDSPCLVFVEIGDDIRDNTTRVETSETYDATMLDFLYTDNATYVEMIVYNLTAPPPSGEGGGSSTTVGNASIVVNIPSTLTLVMNTSSIVPEKTMYAMLALLAVIALATLLNLTKR